MNTITPSATSEAETPIFFEASGETLSGILTEPLEGSLGIAVVLLNGGGHGPSPGRNQMGTRLCRRLASEGFHALRFDYHGVGDSTGAVHHFRLDRPFREDALAAISFLRARGLKRFVLIGGCFGARTALACAADIPGLAGVVLRTLPVRDQEKTEFGPADLTPKRTLPQLLLRAIRPEVVGGLLRRERREAYLRAARNAWRARHRASDVASSGELGPAWLSKSVAAELKALLDLHVPLLLISGRGDPDFVYFERALMGRFKEMFISTESPIAVEILDGRVGSAADERIQQPVIDLIASWLVDSTAEDSLVSL